MKETIITGMDYADRLSRYKAEKEILLQSAADRPASEVDALIEELIKKWRV